MSRGKQTRENVALLRFKLMQCNSSEKTVSSIINFRCRALFQNHRLSILKILMPVICDGTFAVHMLVTRRKVLLSFDAFHNEFKSLNAAVGVNHSNAWHKV